MTTPLSEKALQEARQLIKVFILAWKNYGLYPEDHATTIRSFDNLVAAFGNFFATHGGDLRLSVEKDRLLCESETIHELSSGVSSEDIITLLYRDGIKWIEFQKGLPREEIAAFFRIAHQYRLFTEEIEGDIVTALMDEELEYIDFKAVDIFWQDLLLMDFSELPSPAPQEEEVANKDETDQSRQKTESAGEDINARSIADPAIGDDQLALSDDEYETLERMVKEEEGWDISEDLFELLLIILQSQTEERKFIAVLGYIEEVVVETIELEKFDLLVRLFETLSRLSRSTSSEQGWTRPLINRFFQDLSMPELFELISEKIIGVQPGESDKLKAIDQALEYLSPEIIPYLISAVSQGGSAEIKRMVPEVVVRLSRRDPGPLERIADRKNAEVGDSLLAIISRLKGDRVNEILFKMCDHPSPAVRRKAIKELIERDSKYASKLFAFIDDPSKDIRTAILSAFAKHKSTALENLLLTYLKGDMAQKDPGHIIACYEALGRCGSNMSLPFLRRVLLSQGWNSIMGTGKLVFREGAAVALALLGTREAKDVLRRAAASRFKVIRKAFERTKKM